MHLDGTGLPVTYIAPNLYMDNLVPMADTIRDRALLPAPAGEGRIGFVAASDVAAVAAHALLTGDQEGAVHTVTGPEALSYNDVADRISTVFARQVDYADLLADQVRAEWQAAGRPQRQVDGMLERFEWVRAGGASTVTSDVREATGRDRAPSRTGCRRCGERSSAGPRKRRRRACSAAGPSWGAVKPAGWRQVAARGLAT